ncbi:hypothetical protein QWA68_002007 [Fusarium oxysporum]|nr:hypothetical protein QWA68_002007 [Fusarium oxysporum]
MDNAVSASLSLYRSIVDFDPAHFATDAPPNTLPQYHDGRISRLAAPRTSHYATDHATPSNCSSCWDVEAFPSTHQATLTIFVPTLQLCLDKLMVTSTIYQANDPDSVADHTVPPFPPFRLMIQPPT